MSLFKIISFIIMCITGAFLHNDYLKYEILSRESVIFIAQYAIIYALLICNNNKDETTTKKSD